MGKMDLSAIALKLEQLGRESDVGAITQETPAFLQSLKDYVAEFAPQEDENGDGGDAVDEDPAFLTDKFLEIVAACEDFDDGAVEKALMELFQKSWSRRTKELLNLISEKLLHSDFDDIIEAITAFD
jgi:hypothetical protein